LLEDLGLKKRDIRQVVRLVDNYRRFISQNARVEKNRKVERESRVSGGVGVSG
jgi:hypothetical protein